MFDNQSSEMNQSMCSSEVVIHNKHFKQNTLYFSLSHFLFLPFSFLSLSLFLIFSLGLYRWSNRNALTIGRILYTYYQIKSIWYTAKYFIHWQLA